MDINWSNFTGLEQLPAAANTASDGTFWVAMLYMIWIILILLMIPFGFEVAIIGSSFVAMMIGFLLVYSGLVAWYYVVVFVAVLLFMFLYVTWTSNKNR